MTVRRHLGRQSGTSGHHLHLWPLDGEHHVLTAHLVLRCALTLEQQLHLKRTIADRLREFDLAHTTIEFEFGEEACRDAGVI